MELTTYQTEAAKTAIYPADQGLTYTILGLSSESGELAGKLKKIIRDKGGEATPEDIGQLAAELSDCLWYVANIAKELGLTLDMVARYNLAKLADRANRGVIGGSGDER